MRQSVYLLRHCDYSNPRGLLAGRLPLPLSSKGIKQAELLREYFVDKSILTLYSSAVERCKKTVEIISDNKIPVIFDTRILETLSAYQGYWEENKYSGGYHFFSHIKSLGGESFFDLRKRMASFWDEIFPSIEGNIIICSHGDPLQVLYSYIHNLPLVDCNEIESNIPGWMEKGGFIELVFKNKKLVKTIK